MVDHVIDDLVQTHDFLFISLFLATSKSATIAKNCFLSKTYDGVI